MAVEPQLLARAIDEFYSTTDEQRRQQLNNELCQFKTSLSCDQTVRACFVLLSRENSPNVQYFGALSLYDCIRERWEDILTNTLLTDHLKMFLIDALTQGAQAQAQSVTNKLSASLALMALYAIPDIWATPVQDLTGIWAATPELLLRVLAELAAEFPNVHMPLTQRSVLKTELHRVSEDMIRILATVLNAADSSPSLLNAAVECVEQWLRLPGSNLRQWTDLLSSVFAAVRDDSTALTNLLSILGNNEDMVNEDQLVQQVLEYICNTLSQKVLSDLSEDPLDEEATALAGATCSICETVVGILIRIAQTDTQLLVRLCSYFASLSCMNAPYPSHERVSDLPNIFFGAVREEICCCSSKQRGKQLIEAVDPIYTYLLSNGIDKLSYPVFEDYLKLSQEDRELFESYRRNRSEVGLNAYHICGRKALRLLNDQLNVSLGQSKMNKIESILYIWEHISDYLTEEVYVEICEVLEFCSKNLNMRADGQDGIRMAGTLMRLLYALSHLISAHPNSVQLEQVAVSLVLAQLDVREVTEEALKTLLKIVEDRPNWLLDGGEEILVRCFAIFQNESFPSGVRLTALKCIGFTLSLRPAENIMEVLRNVLDPYLAGISDSSGDAKQDETARKSFQISMFSCLFTSIHNTKSTTDQSGEATIVWMLRQTAEIFLRILKDQCQPVIADRVCDALRSACLCLPECRLVDFFPFFVEVINGCLDSNPLAACSFAKTLVLCSRVPAPALICSTVAEWAERFDRTYPMENVEEPMGLLIQVLKKEWNILAAHPQDAQRVIRSTMDLATKALSTSEEPQVVKLAAQLLATIASQTSSFDSVVAREILAQGGETIVKIVFRRVQCELVRQTIEALAEVLFFFAKDFTTATKQCIVKEENGDTPMVLAMFREIGNLRNFKQMTLRLNHAARKDLSV